MPTKWFRGVLSSVAVATLVMTTAAAAPAATVTSDELVSDESEYTAAIAPGINPMNVTFAVFGDVPESADGTVSVSDLAAVGVTDQDINIAMANYDVNGGVWTNDGTEIHPTDFPIPTVDGPEPSGLETPDATNSAYRVLGSWNDSKGKKVALRAGSFYNGNGWGYAKISTYHNLSSRAVKAATAYTPKKEFVSGTKYEFSTPVKKVNCKGWGIFRKCSVVARTTVITSHEARVLNDGLPRGVITSFCSGYLGPCPDWVKKAANV